MSRRWSFSELAPAVDEVEDACQQRAGDAVPHAADGRGYGCLRHGGKVPPGQHRGQPGILHADFDAEGAPLGAGHAGGAAHAVPQGIAQRIVQEYGEEDERAAGEEAAAFGRGHAAHDACQADDGEPGHHLADFGIAGALAPFPIAEGAYGHGQDGYEENAAEHARGVYINAFAGEPEHEQGCHERGEQGGDGGHAHGVGHISLAEEAHDVAGDAARAAAHQDEPCRNAPGQVEALHQCPGHQREHSTPAAALAGFLIIVVFVVLNFVKFFIPSSGGMISSLISLLLSVLAFFALAVFADRKAFFGMKLFENKQQVKSVFFNFAVFVIVTIVLGFILKILGIFFFNLSVVMEAVFLLVFWILSVVVICRYDYRKHGNNIFFFM